MAKWTKERPTEAGWYWYAPTPLFDGSPVRMTMTQVVSRRVSGKQEFLCWPEGNREIEILIETYDGDWWRIEIPEWPQLIPLSFKEVTHEPILKIAADQTSDWRHCNKLYAKIGTDGIFHFCIDPTDENTRLFVQHLEEYLRCRLTGIKVNEVTP